MAKFTLLKTANFSKCLKAIEQVLGEDGKLFIQESRLLRSFPNKNIELKDFRDFYNTDISWEYIITYKQDSAWYYENSDGVIIDVIENNGISQVEKIVGISKDIANKLGGFKNNISLYESIERFVYNHLDRDKFDLRITEYI